MALVLGTNSGFVTTAPTGDPEGSFTQIDDRSYATKDTSPATAIKIIKVGWYQQWSGNGAANFEVGLYSDDGAGEPNLLLEVERTNSLSASSVGWKEVDVDWDISSNTSYWLAVQVDNTSPSVYIDRAFSEGLGFAEKTTQTTLLSDWETSSTKASTYMMAIYAVWEEAAAGFTRKIKISGTFQDKPIKTKVAGTFEDKLIKIKVGGTFQDV